MPYQSVRNPIENWGFSHKCMKWHASTLLCSDIYIQQYKTEYWLICYKITGGKISQSWFVQRMAWCLMAPSHCLDQCWLIIHWGSILAFTKSNFTGNAQDTYLWDVFVKYKFKITTASPSGQWVNSLILKSSWCIILRIKICVKLIFLAPFAY